MSPAARRRRAANSGPAGDRSGPDRRSCLERADTDGWLAVAGGAADRGWRAAYCGLADGGAGGVLVRTCGGIAGAFGTPPATGATGLPFSGVELASPITNFAANS